MVSRARQAQDQRLLVDIDARDFQRLALAAEGLKTQRSIKLPRGYLYCRHVERDPLEAGLGASSLEQRHHQLAADAMPAPLLRDIYTPDKSLVAEFFTLFADEAGNTVSFRDACVRLHAPGMIQKQ